MSLTGMRNKLHKHAVTAIVVVAGAAMLLPAFFSGALGGGGRRNLPPEEQRRQEALENRDQVVATVGSMKVTRGELDDNITAQGSQIFGQQNVTPMQRLQLAPRVLEQIENTDILVQAAKKQGIDVSNADIRAEMDKEVRSEAEATGVYREPDKDQQRLYENQIRNQVEARRDQITNSLITQKLIENLRKKINVNDPTLKPEDKQVSARHILITWKGLSSADKKVTRTQADAKALATKIADQAKANPSGFAQLADQYTEDPSGKGKGGDLGWVSKGQMVKPFDAAVFSAKPGSIVGPVQTQFGYHVIKIEDQRVADSRVNQEVMKFLDEQKKSIKPVVVASDLKAMQTYQDYMTAKMSKGQKDLPAKRQAAVAAFEAAAKDQKSDPSIFMMLGSLYKDAGDNQKSLAAYQKAADLPPANADVHMALGNLYRDTKQKQKAIDEYKIAGRLAGTDTNIHAQLQMAYHDMGETELAKQQSEWLRNAQQSPMGGQPLTIPGGG